MTGRQTGARILLYHLMKMAVILQGWKHILWDSKTLLVLLQIIFAFSSSPSARGERQGIHKGVVESGQLATSIGGHL